MTIEQFVNTFVEKGIKNTQMNPHAVSDYVNSNVEVNAYLPFATKRRLAEMVGDSSTEEVDGVWKHDAISAYIGFVMTMISSHTDLQCGDNPIDDYDALAEHELLMPVIDLFKTDYNECDVVRKMALAAKLEENNVSVLVGKFLNNILYRLDSVGGYVKAITDNINLQELIKDEDLAKLTSFLNTYVK